MIANRMHNAKQFGNKLHRDERGSLLTIEFILLATVIGLGMVVGLSTFRTSMTQEFGDVAAGMASIDHGYNYNDLANFGTIDNLFFDFEVLGSTYIDESNFCEPATLDPSGNSPMCIEFTADMISNEEGP